MIIVKTKLIFFSLIIFLSFFLLSNPLFALTVMSPILELEIEPGKSQSGFVKLYNETNSDLILTSSLESFKAGDETGQPIFLAPEQKDQFLNWFIDLPGEIILRPQQVILAPFIVEVPANAAPGGYYAAIFWQMASGQAQNGSGAGVSGRIGTLVFLKVIGEVKESLTLTEFQIAPSRKYFFSFPLNFIAKINNQGNIHLAPQGQITLTGWLGRKIDLEVNSEKRFILPDSSRRFDVVWGSRAKKNFWQDNLAELYLEFKNLPFGRYQANFNLSFGSQNQTLIGNLSFWFIPWRLILVLFLFIIFLVMFGRINRKIKKLKNKLEKLENEKKQSN